MPDEQRLTAPECFGRKATCSNGYASSRPERAKEISRGQAERCPRSQTGEETRPGGALDTALNAPTPLQGAQL